MLITRFFRKISILKQADIFLPFKTVSPQVLLRFQKKYGIIISKKIREKPDKGEKHDIKSNYTENIR